VIRINLLPDVRRAGEPKSGSPTWLIALVVICVLEVIGCFVLYGQKQQELADWGQKNQNLQSQIKISQDKVADHDKVKQQLEQLRAREEAITKLQTARTGPTGIMLEISRILTPGRGPSVAPERLDQVKNDNPLAMFTPHWDPRRLWLLSFVEEARTVKLTGLARDGEDVSELARRMNLSSYFYDVRLLPGKRELTKGAAIDWVSFQLEARVRY
jgi:type IV pilus assembly protein PilN